MYFLKVVGSKFYLVSHTAYCCIYYTVALAYDLEQRLNTSYDFNQFAITK